MYLHFRQCDQTITKVLLSFFTSIDFRILGILLMWEISQVRKWRLNILKQTTDFGKTTNSLVRINTYFAVMSHNLLSTDLHQVEMKISILRWIKLTHFFRRTTQHEQSVFIKLLALKWRNSDFIKRFFALKCSLHFKNTYYFKIKLFVWWCNSWRSKNNYRLISVSLIMGAGQGRFPDPNSEFRWFVLIN